MNRNERREFLKKTGILALGAAFLPDLLFAKSNPKSPNTKPGHTRDWEFGVVDLHSHSSQKIYLWTEHMWMHHLPTPGENIGEMQVDIHRLKRGNVRGIMATHYLPERCMKEDMQTLRWWLPAIKTAAPRLYSKIEKGSPANYRQLIGMMDDFEYQINHLQTKHCLLPEQKIKIARSFAEYKHIIEVEKKIAVAHAIEGAHALGRDLSFEQIKTNLDFLVSRGVCMMTLAHFFPNDVAFPVEGLSATDKKGLQLRWVYKPAVDNRPLTAIGVQVVDWMLENGMVVDLTHATPAIRTQVFTKNAQRGDKLRPLIFSHVGCQAVYDKYDGQHQITDPQTGSTHGRFHDFGYYNVTDDEIRLVHACKGVIGIIPENFWLTGGNTHMQCDGYKPKDFRKGIKYIVETMEHIHSVTGTYENIGIGSDFDGLADAPSDLFSHAQMGNLTEAMSDAGISDDNIKAIMHGNAMRVLENGWGKQVVVS
ncbi:MAG: Zn-dependent dipeptidase [Bacteroidota bacterium]|nr:Zn-dependent dipeptidase [Bacteroidota bacterium]